jgi:hypothetical protein
MFRSVLGERIETSLEALRAAVHAELIGDLVGRRCLGHRHRRLVLTAPKKFADSRLF